MKTMLKITMISAMLMGCQASFGQEIGEQTEEYAILYALSDGFKFKMSTTIGSSSSEAIEYKQEKGLRRYDMAPVIAEMTRINKMGYDLFSTSVLVTTLIFVFKKRKPDQK